MAERPSAANRLLIGGWFSLDDGGAAVGHLAALDVVRAWLDGAVAEHLASRPVVTLPIDTEPTRTTAFAASLDRQ